MDPLLNQLRTAFQRRDNGLTQLIIINVGLFAVMAVAKVILALSGASEYYLLAAHQLMLPALPEKLLFRPWSLLTYFFFHQEVFHILFNMLALYWFGQLIQEFIGSKRLIALYLLGGLAGGLFYIAICNLFPYYAASLPALELLGASGAVYAVMTAAATLLPDHAFNLLLIGRVRIVYIALFYIVLSFIDITGPNSGGKLAHLGGALLGYLYIRQLKAGNDWGKPITYLGNLFSNMFAAKPAVKVSYKNTQRPSGTAPTVPNQAEIDSILDKISKSGYESLSRDEKQKLFKASQKD